jgi:tRNA threonylcarbamoyladenosine modification (KEOPS) complex Cgi121 subunit
MPVRADFLSYHWESVLATPVKIETHSRLASMRQIHCAIEHLHRGDYECAITLASAAEGMLLEPDAKYLRNKINDMSEKDEIKAAGGATKPNDFATWLKHGTYNGKKTENEIVIIPSEESVAWVRRAISKYQTVYSDLSPQMRGFNDWAEQWLRKELGRE